MADTFESLLGRTASQPDLVFWGNIVDQFGDRTFYDTILHSKEHRLLVSGG